jgi:hypothetical protein
MSGSLNIRGDLGKWVATTANNSLAVSQSLLTFSGFITVNSYSATANSSVFATTTGGGFSVSLITFNSIRIFLHGVTVTFSHDTSIVLGQTIHFAGTINATGTSKIYINGAVVGSNASIGATPSGAAGIQCGWSGTAASNVLISDFAIWAGTELAQSDIVSLRDRSTTPATASTPASSWWTLKGTAGANPAVSDSGMVDQIGSNHFTTLPGSGGTSTAAIYSATDIIYHAPVTVNAAYVARSGGIVFFFLGTNPLLGSVSPCYVTAVNSNPTILVNGTPASIEGPYWSSTNHAHPHVGYQIVGNVGPTDVVTWSTSDSWATASQGSASPESGTAANYTGQYEPGLYGYIGFDPPDSWKTMKVGWNLQATATTGETSLLKNAVHRVGTWTNVTAFDALGWPTTIGSGFSGTATGGSLWNSGDNNGINALSGFPTPTGQWTIIGDESVSATPTVLSLIGSANAAITSLTGVANTPTITAGVSDGHGGETGKRWDWNVNYVASPTAFNLAMGIKLQTHNAAAGANTLTNVKIFEPGNAPSLTPEQTINDNVARMVSAGPGVYTPIVRAMEALAGSDGASAIALGSDFFAKNRVAYGLPAISAATDWPLNNPTFTGFRQIPIYSVRTYDTTVTPHVYASVQYRQTVASDDPAYPYMWDLSPSGLNLGYDWAYPAGLFTNNNIVVVEFVCADSSGNPITHNLTSGQFITFGTIAAGVTTQSGTGTASVTGATQPVWVTSKTTFIGIFGSTTAATCNRLGNVTVGAPQVQTWATAVSTCPAYGTGGVDFSIEDVGGVPAGIGNAGLWIAVNHCMTDAGVTAYATRLYNSTVRGTKIFVQLSNELFISNTQFGWLNQLASLEFGTSGTTTYTGKACAQRTSEVHTIFRSVWGSDADSVVRVFQAFSLSVGTLSQALTYAQQNSITFDKIAISDYLDMDFSSTFQTAAAQICASDTRSAANGSPVLPMAAYQDLLRHHIKYTSTRNGSSAPTPACDTAITTTGYGQGSGGFFCPRPTLIAYEAAFTTAVPGRVSLTSKVVRAGLSHDVMYHPSFYDTINAFLQHLQQPGPAGTPGFEYVCIEGLCGLRQAGGNSFTCSDGADNSFVSLWATYIWQGQQAGDGASNKFWAGDLGGTATGAGGSSDVPHDLDNQSVNGLAYADWIAATAEGAQSDTAVSFHVSPGRIQPSQSVPVLLRLTGTNTTWTSGSIVSITNSLTGTTTVTAGTWTQISATFATLTVTTGMGAGTYKITIDGVDSPVLGVGSRRKGWFGTLRPGRRPLLRIGA